MFVQTSSLCFMRATLFRVLCSRNISIQTHLPSLPCLSIFNRRDPIPTRLVKAVLSAVVNYSGNREMPKKIKTNKGSQKPSETSPSLPSGPVARDKNGVVTISVHAKPGSKQNAITDISEDAIGVAIAAPPSDGEANAELVRYLSKVLELKKSEVVLDKGSRSREKLIKVSASLTPEEALERLKQESTR